MKKLRPLAWLCAVLLLAGCAELLPKSRAETHAEWPTFDAVRVAIEKVEPYKTTKADLQAQGIGAPGDPTITLLSHVDIAIRFPIGGVLKEEDVDPGIRDCMKAGKACSGYLVNMRRIKRDRIGNFWADAFAFRRETDVSGWTSMHWSSLSMTWPYTPSTGDNRRCTRRRSTAIRWVRSRAGATGRPRACCASSATALTLALSPSEWGTSPPPSPPGGEGRYASDT